MKHSGFIILLLLVPILLRAQSVGEVRYGSEVFEGGLRVGRKPNMRCKKGVVLRQSEKNPSRYDYWWEGMEVYGHFFLDENGRIKEIGCWFNAC